MLPNFTSAELNQLLQLELAEGLYHSPEDALLEGLKTLRERRAFQSQMTQRLASFDQGLATIANGDEALAQFLDEIDAEVDSELQLQAGAEK